jgi:hypothetical protein
VALGPLAGCANNEGGIPSDAECARRWNDAGNRGNQANVVKAGFRSAAAYGWTDKANDRGCGVVFWRRPRGPWAIYAATLPRLEVSSQDWDFVEGRAWGSDSPAGEIPDAGQSRVNPDGTIAE